MCMSTPSMPAYVPPPVAPPPPPPPAVSATTPQVRPATAPETKPTVRRRNPLRTDSGATDEVATGLNIPS
jgi:hypothetical protein